MFLIYSAVRVMYVEEKVDYLCQLYNVYVKLKYEDEEF